ncbi:long polar fimbrial protein LpfA [Pseudomonas sp. FW306-02-F02-AA]|uniref:Fimbrial protein n=1 Tax=Pseudomonas fluorescens TaxID=294 RepID=A0A0N7H0E4_PSEFL|nr:MULTISPECIES: fimbrial protein [Pseudomonas]ALI02908.1 fimbrial protein [Pseudomonas fluorescens]PMZ04342.1 long polar fimbrial protein LpfA [Pseudomonas sp. FW306-02-F02-AB]PMZ10575.1 long polar fimbrial protein LpfA [Pseudomonas sp. FW306-02-H06C]PMZ15969.1 long polar fimbrial protein LpfA [Pseudomonas sp. FW306-02-F02-AA]PMZ21897.1 long polar fimbrial protein LpfA [Pseudomonas sp. FW306-02-F08-AA]
MKKLSLTLLTLSMLAAAGQSFAADPVVPTKAGSGTINFSGVINNDACSIEDAGIGKTISVPMGDVSIKDMGTASAPKGSGKLSAENFDMKINCNAGTKVAMIFQPTTGAGTGLVTGTKVLKLIDGVGAARGIGIALLDANGDQIDLSSPTAAKIENTLQDGNATLKFSAAYVTTGDVKTAVAGRGDATLPFTLQYE